MISYLMTANTHLFSHPSSMPAEGPSHHQGEAGVHSGQFAGPSQGHTHSHSHLRNSFESLMNLMKHAFGLWEEAGLPKKQPTHEQGERANSPAIM